MNNKVNQIIPSVNYHLWEPCNFRCKYCFATFQDVRKTILPKGHLPKEDALRLVDELALAGLTKITFVGGEPTLCPWLSDLIIRAKELGLITMVVTNGTGLNDQLLEKTNGYLDWVVLSIDSIDEEIIRKIGRHQGNRIVPNQDYFREKVDLVNKWGLKLKINTVINRYNFEDLTLSPFIMSLNPKRWKIFQALRVEGQNDKHFDEVSIDQKEFEYYLKRNNIADISIAVIEDNDAMTGTYLMVDPAGRFFDNTKGHHTYSEPILKVGFHEALKGVSYDYDEFIARNGLYDFE